MINTNPFKEPEYTPEDINVINKEPSVEELINQEVKNLVKTKRDQNVLANIMLSDDQRRRMKTLERIKNKKGIVDIIRK